MKSWYVVHTQSSSEERAAWNLKNQGFEVFLPLYKKLRRHARKVEEVVRPLFPRYLFVALDANTDRWRAINGTYGVNYIVSNGETPLPLPPQVVDDIKERQNEDGYVVLDPPKFNKGEKLRVVEGTFAEHIALFEGMNGKDRVILLLEMLGRQVKVCASLNAIQSIR